MYSLYSKYIAERTNDKVLEIPEGFATYRYINDNKAVYIIDIYVLPEFRNKKIACEMADRIVKEAKELGCKELIGTVVPSAKGSTASLKVLLGYGMTLNSAANDVVVFRKEI
jgi:ribosomal protein S18 acetylase RimI-like enzyme